MNDATQKESKDLEPRVTEAAREDLNAAHERERWLRDHLDRERAENLLLLRYLSVQREPALMRFWRWLIDDLRSERPVARAAAHAEAPASSPVHRPGMAERFKRWSENLADRFQKKGETPQ